MPKSRDAAKERYWRKLIGRHARSGLGTGRFCQQLGVPEHRFHWLRRTLRRRDEQAARRVSCDQAVPAIDAGNREEEGPAFLPVHLPLSLGGLMEVVHPRGYVIRLPALFDATALERILTVLDGPTAS